MKLKRLKPVHYIPVSFLAAIIAGTILLMLPISSASGKGTDILTALFTATTSVCVTGLVVVDTYAHWSFFGQLVILILIQIGGLGVVAVGSMIMVMTKRKLFLSNRMLLGDSLNVDGKKGLIHFLKRMFRGVAIIEVTGIIIYSIKFIPMLGFFKGLWASVFQSISAFCNAGMDIVGPNSMIDLRDSNLLMITTMSLIIIGGIGFVVWFDVIEGIKNAITYRYNLKQGLSHLPEHTKIVLIMTAILILSGSVIVFAAEYNNPDTIGQMSLSGKIMNSVFQSVTYRTAGFASVPQDKLTEISCTAGYINAYSYINGKSENVVFHKRVPEDLMKKASAIILFSLTAIFIMNMLLMSRGGISHTDSLYEVISALGTVGLSRGLTPNLDSIGRIIIIVSMYLGRIGPISMAIFLAKGNHTENSITHANGKFYVG